MTFAALAATIRRFPWWATVAAVLFTIKFVVIAALVGLDVTRAIDLATTLTFQSIASDPLDLVANADTLVGQLVVTLALALALAAVAWRRLGPVAALALALVLVTGPIELLMKSILVHPGPPLEFIRAFHNLLGIKVATQASFPSGHIARVTFLVLVVASLYPRGWTPAAAALFVVLTVFLRVYIGDHWISDALGGLALGAAFAAIAVGWIRASARR